MGAGVLAKAMNQSYIWRLTLGIREQARPLQGGCGDDLTLTRLGSGLVLDLSKVLFAQLRQILRTVRAAQFLQRTAHTLQLAVHRL